MSEVSDSNYESLLTAAKITGIAAHILFRTTKLVMLHT